MKKLTAITLTLVFMLSLTACDDSGSGSGSGSSSGSNSSSSSGGASSTDGAQSSSDQNASSSSDNTPKSSDNGDGETGKAMASLIKWMKDGSYSFDYTSIEEWPEGTAEGKGSMAMDGDKMAVTSEVTRDGKLEKVRIIKSGDKLYMIDDESKTIMEMSAGDEEMGDIMMDDYGNIVKIGDGTGEVNGKTLPYEEYDSGEDGGTVKYYLDGDDVYAIETTAEEFKNIMIITNASDKAPAGAFDLPTDYTSMNLNDLLPDGFEMPDGFELPD